MVRMSRASWGLAMLMVAGALACSEDDPEPDGGVVSHADAVDDYDGGIRDAIIRDRGVSDAEPDAGAPDVGACGCSYGFQQQCAEDEFCGGYYYFPDRSMCVRAEPFGSVAEGGCSQIASSTVAPGAACNAQCVPTSHGSPCSDVEDRSLLADIVGAWGQAARNASTMGPLPGPNSMRPPDVGLARSLAASIPECGVFVERTVIAAVSLCRGEGSVVPPEPGQIVDPFAWKFRHIDEKDGCQLATALCVAALSAGVRGGVGAASAVDEIPMSCTAGLPYADPCTGPDAQRCVRTRVESMIRALNEN